MRRYWVRRGAGTALWRSGLLMLATAACGDDGGSVLACGDGTERQGDKCLAVDAGPAYEGKKDSGGEPPPADAGSDPQAATSCGEGTVKKAGKCVVDPATTVACGDGTVRVDGKCQVAPPPPVALENMVISQLSLRNRGQLVSDGGKIHQFYPVEVSVGITYKGDAARIPVVFALGEPPNPDKTAEEEKDLGFCLVGGFYVDHPGGTSATESIASATLNIPKGCLPANKSSLKVSPIVMIDPDLTLDVADHDAISRMVVFAKKNNVDADMAACRVDATLDGAKGTCQVEAEVDASPGLDFELAELTAESSVTVLDKCSPSADMDRPASYRCNHSIVPEFKIVRDDSGKPVLDEYGNQQIVLDVNGKPEQATYSDNGTDKPKWVYGPADLDLDVTVMAYGADDSKLNSADDAKDLSPTDNTMAVNNVLTDHGLQIQYSIRPSKSPNLGPDSWKPLYMHKQGEQAKAGEEGESGQDKAPFEETKVVPATPHYYSHGLYVENDCGERNTATCNPNLHPRTDIIGGDWSAETDFVVRACLVPVDDNGDEDAAFDDNADNNCRELPIKIVRHDTTGTPTMAASYGFNFQWGDGAGSQTTMRLGWALHSWNRVDTTGAITDNEAAVTLGSDLVGYTDILKGWAKGAAYVSLAGSYYDYGISTFGIKLWGDAKTASQFHWGQDWSVTKELRKGTIVWAGCVPIQLELRFGGTAGVAVDLDIVGANIPLNGTEESETFLKSKTTGLTGLTRIGLAQLAVTPYGVMTATASASITAGVVRAGVAGDLTLINMRIPLTGRMWWGLTNLSPLTLKTGVWADLKLNLSVMSGEVYLFAENQSLDWCSKRIKVGWVRVTVRYACGYNWNTFWDYSIADWDGWTWNQTLWTSPYVEYTVQ
jgi:hypothetical protein